MKSTHLHTVMQCLRKLQSPSYYQYYAARWSIPCVPTSLSIAVSTPRIVWLLLLYPIYMWYVGELTSDVPVEVWTGCEVDCLFIELCICKRYQGRVAFSSPRMWTSPSLFSLCVIRAECSAWSFNWLVFAFPCVFWRKWSHDLFCVTFLWFALMQKETLQVLSGHPQWTDCQLACWGVVMIPDNASHT